MQNEKCKMKNEFKYIKFLIFGLWILVFGFTATGSGANSIWNENSTSPYSTGKGYKVGDIINVIILESTSAKNLPGTKTDVRDDLGAKFSHTIKQLAPVIGTNNSLSGQAFNNYNGAGQTSRQSNVQARISALVSEVYSNGNLSIVGTHKVEVNDEVQEITISGIVRPKDISGANTIYSYQVANADLSIKGTVTVAESGAPGWISRIFNWLF